MRKSIVASKTLFEVKDVFGKTIRTSERYWRRIVEEKHVDLRSDIDAVIETVRKPDSVYRSVRDSTVALYRRKGEDGMWLVVVAKHLNGTGFIVTVYQTSKMYDKGERLWPT